ncbi:universal stress protein [Streptacidiphilus carbonis]|jgi:nucleotide-binding universal stress UspA family protein|uniref:universal stress protein n=1 Tax=Streptacidiphilus carbonis TaxID=105422 RepID=UPI0005A74DB3|nr:universal stress protein [Streptacidiphilus carbonis]
MTGDQGRGRIVVGVSGSLANLAALRHSVFQARTTNRPLVAVLAWTPPGGEVGYRAAPCPPLAQVWRECAQDQLRTAFEQALGGLPADLDIQPMVIHGPSGPALCAIADNPDDLLVIGAGRRGTRARTLHGHVSRYVLANARCPVLAVPWTCPFKTSRHALRHLEREATSNG